MPSRLAPTLLATVAMTLAACQAGFVRPRAPETPQPAARAEVVPESERRPGPLSLRGEVAETSWPERQRLRRLRDERYMSAEEMRADVAAFLEVAEIVYVPRTAQERESLRVARQVDIIIGLAPYSLEAVGDAFGNATYRLGLCALHTGVSAPCHHDLPGAPAPSAEHPYEVSEREGVGLLTVRDLSDASYPAWAELLRDAEPLTQGVGIVVDLREAWGDDPRAMLPWVEQISGRSPLRPLREIRRAPELATYVDAYRSRYSVHTRDPEVWSALVGTTPPPSSSSIAPPIAPPIAVLIGPRCESACELLARALQTYAGATVLGARTNYGRVGWDEPAVLRLPYSGIDVFFYAAEHLFSEEIEEATGPTHAWTAGGDSGELLEYALREVRLRATNPGGWPTRCDTHAESLPATPKLRGLEWLTRCTEDLHIEIHADLPQSAMRRFLGTCAHPPTLSWGSLPGRFLISVPRDEGGAATLRQLSHADVVDRVEVDCEPLPQPG